MKKPTGKSAASSEPTAIVQLRVTESERVEYRKAAERCGMSLAAWMRDRLNLAIKREAKEA